MGSPRVPSWALCITLKSRKAGQDLLPLQSRVGRNQDRRPPGASGPPFQEILSTILSLDFLLCPTTPIDNLGGFQSLFCFSPLSSPDKEIGAPSRLLGQPEKEPIPFPSSQSSFGRFVPQFAKPKKTETRQAATKEEDLGSGAFSLETPPEPSVQQAGSQSWEESPGLTIWEARKPGDQTQAHGTCSEHNVQNPVTPMSSRGNSQPEVSNDASPEWRMVPSASERASQDHLLEQGTNLPDSGSTERGGIPGDYGQKGRQPNSDAEEEEPDRGAPQEEGAQGGAGDDQEEGDSILELATWDPEPRSVAQGPPHLMQTLSRAGWEAEGSCNSPRCSSLMTTVSTDTINPKQRALEVAGPGGKVNTRMPAPLSGKAPAGGHSGALLRGVSLVGETTGDRGEVEWEAKPPGDVLEGPAASLTLANEIQEPTISAGDSSPVASEMGPAVDQTQVPGLDQEGLGGLCALPLLSQPSGEEAAELDGQSHEQDLGGLNLSLGASAVSVHREAVDGPPLDAKAHRGSPDAIEGLGGQPNWPDSADQAALGGSPAIELDFLPDSQIQDALEAPDFEAPLKQFPAGSGLGPCWPGTSLLADGGRLSKAQPSTYEKIKPCEAARMEDATGTIRGLVVELSNLNRLIMTAHRDLEAFKRLSYCKAKPVVKAPLPYTSKGAGTGPHGEQSWRDL
ncbi:break repair meiotic recombinase recruitment factor 1 isoform 1-T1 [Hipposideros larvatus]